MIDASGLPGLTVEPLDAAASEAMLERIFDAIRLERRLPWFKASVPRRFVYRYPPRVN